MRIELKDAGRRFNQEWIYRHVSYLFEAPDRYAVLGPNGSGKSTLLSLLLGNLAPSEGEISYTAADGSNIPVDEVYKHLSFAAPYLDLIEEFTLQETIDFHFKFKKVHPNIQQSEILTLLGLKKSQDKPLKYFSSGMKQRTKLILACCSNTPMLCLDEPTSNLDVQGIAWYQQLIEQFADNRLVIVCSNQPNEYLFCNHVLEVTDYK
jgi:ABC-type multidrug transport system ATPase subunit